MNPLPIGGGTPHCKRCGYELESASVETCPRCQYSPRQRGLRVALVLLLVFVLLMTAVVAVPTFGPLLIGLAGLSFLLSFVTILVSFLATPHRFGSLFLRL